MHRAARLSSSLAPECRRHTSTAAAASAGRPRPIPVLRDASITTFRDHAFTPATPALLPRGALSDLPAITRWFQDTSSDGGARTLNVSYLARFGAVRVPLEISHAGSFARVEQPFSYFLACAGAATSRYDTRGYFNANRPGSRRVRRVRGENRFFDVSAPSAVVPAASSLAEPTASVYLAQASIAGLARGMREDVPVPEIVRAAGKGDVYDSSVWLGVAPTYTPLHRDPNPNLFVQLAGSKVLRLFRPEIGAGIFAGVQEKIGGRASATIRGEEMMQGEERRVLEAEVWDNGETVEHCWEAHLQAGDALFIPKGWWHSVKGVGTDMNGSVNWWFR